MSTSITLGEVLEAQPKQKHSIEGTSCGPPICRPETCARGPQPAHNQHTFSVARKSRCVLSVRSESNESEFVGVRGTKRVGLCSLGCRSSGGVV